MGAEKKKKIKEEKPIDKMTVKELREVAKEIPEITGVHGMNKAELIGSIKKARSIKDAPRKKADASVRDIKLKIRKLKAEREAFLKADNKKMAIISKRRISRLKKKTRKAA
ncbi:MAG: Rho termination factor N-terminal domain-containing protein [Proteobacteria bacterium]|nr:Rho termination factor N-terminal domain-containing protein [Pseudomonadota bacterium]MBU4464082.1 Rho termination factor N-terminal domain-containing protein [Pseudomonadota bacterium]NQT10099.1 Rho termination factor N-terminal domain-containing protein [Desulfobacteraceae bacterium]